MTWRGWSGCREKRGDDKDTPVCTAFWASPCAGRGTQRFTAFCQRALR